MSDTLTSTPDPAEAGLVAALPGGPERYEILEQVAAGGMGAVYRGRHRLLDRPVAIKVCLPGMDVSRFRREAQLLASLRSPHVVAVHDFDTLPDGRAILVMDWVGGTDLRRVLEEHPGGVPEAEAVGWMADVCEGMRAAEDRRVVHRDLKPSNILLDRPGGRALVADFGLARSSRASGCERAPHGFGGSTATRGSTARRPTTD
jgi:serine/threonine-protein kinase